MMQRFRRLLACFLACMMFLFSLAVPSYANELEWINVLDYAMPNDGDSTQFSLPSGTTTVFFTLPIAINVNLIDMLVRTTSSDLKAQFGSRTLTSVTVDTSYAKRVRIYGYAGGSQYQRIPITFTTSSACTVFIDKFYISPLWWADFPDVGQVILNVGSTTYTYTQPAKSEAVTFEFVPAASGLSPFNLSFSCANWAMYDFLRFDLYIKCMEITSVTGLFGTKAIDCEVTQIYDGTSDYDAWYVEVTLDLSNINHAVTAYTPQVFVVGTARGGANCTCIFGETVGFIEADVNLDNHFFRQWLSKIYDRLGTIDSSLGDVQSSLGDIFTYIQTIPTAIGSLFSSYYSKLDTWISNQTNSIGEMFNGLYETLRIEFKSQTDSINGYIEGVQSVVISEFTKLKSLLNSLFSMDTSSSEEFQDDLATQATELQGIAGELDNVTKPPVDDVPIDVDQYVSDSDISQIGNGLSPFFESSIFFPMIMISLVCSLGSFVVYGKRG